MIRILLCVLCASAVNLSAQSVPRTLLAIPFPVHEVVGGNEITFRGVGQTNNASNGSSTTSVTTNAPDANALVICYVVTQGTGSEEIPTITGHGMEWVLVATTNNGNVYRISVFRALTNDTPTADAVVADFGGATQTTCLIRVVQFGGVDTSGTAGAGAVVQVAMETATSENPALTLAAISNAENAVYAGFGNELDPFSAEPETDWEEDWDSGADSSLGIYNTVRVGTTDNTVVVTSISSTWVGIALEVKVAP